MINTDKTRTNIARYTTRDFAAWKEYLVNYIKRYYPDTIKDFTEASWNSLITNLCSLMGENASFYLDYNFNESFASTALEYDTVLLHAKEKGYKPQFGYSAYGKVAVYVTVPAATTGLAPDVLYIPVLKKGSIVSSVSGVNFIILQDVFFEDAPEVRVGQVDPTTGTPISYVLKKYIDVMSGSIKYIESVVGDYEQFSEVIIDDINITEVMSVYDSEGFQYYEVDSLGQNTVFQEIPYDGILAQSVLKPITVSRRFVADYNVNNVTLKFGGGSDGDLGVDYVNDPQSVVLDFYGRNYISSVTLDPFKLVSNDKFGVAPANTTLKITYRANSSDNVNVGIGMLNSVTDSETFFKDRLTLNENSIQGVIQSLNVYNEEAINGSVVNDTSEELKNRIDSSFSAQQRGVTTIDYRAAVYAMPSRFGGIKRCSVVARTSEDLKTELDFYLIGQDGNGKLSTVNTLVKSNLATWLTKIKMSSDRCNLLDAKIINLGIDFEILIERGFDRYNVLSEATKALNSYYQRVGEVGEAFSTTAIYSTLKDVNGVIDITRLNIKQKKGGVYSDVAFDLKANFSKDGRYIKCPKNAVFEIKYPTQDIQGVVR